MDYVRNSNLEDRDYRKTKRNYDETLEQAQSLQRNGKFLEAINEY